MKIRLGDREAPLLRNGSITGFETADLTIVSPGGLDPTIRLHTGVFNAVVKTPFDGCLYFVFDKHDLWVDKPGMVRLRFRVRLNGRMTLIVTSETEVRVCREGEGVATVESEFVSFLYLFFCLPLICANPELAGVSLICLELASDIHHTIQGLGDARMAVEYQVGKRYT